MAAGEIDPGGDLRESAARRGASVGPQDLRPEYDRLAREAAGRAARRDEFDPREALAAVDAAHRESPGPPVRHGGRGLGARRPPRGTLLRRGRARDGPRDPRRLRPGSRGAVSDWGPAALEEAPAPEELSTDLRRAAGDVERAAAAEAAGRFAEARSLLQEAADIAGETMQSPGRLKTATCAGRPPEARR